MNLVIDAGNSNLKYAVFNENELLNHGKCNYDSASFELEKQLRNEIDLIAYSSVKENVLTPFLNQNSNIPQICINSKSNFPFKISYKTPETLGSDRLVACAGAYALQQYNNRIGAFLVIDIGTCITYEWVNENRIYLGGAISPGINLRFKAMNNYTDQLPLINLEDFNLQLIGNSTKSSMVSGVLNGITYEIIGFINAYSGLNQKFNIYLTGGDGVFFENALKCSIFAEPLLNLRGINELIKINA